MGTENSKWHILYQNPETATTPGFEQIELVLKPSPSKDRERLFERLRREIKDDRVLDAIERVPRELFVPPELRSRAYADTALPIGNDQTISQPTIVAMMTSGLKLTGTERVLEIGTGSGYQTAILSYLAKAVVTVERQRELAVHSELLLRSLGITNVRFCPAERGLGMAKLGPYDAIIATAAAPSIPASLVEQLKVGGRMIIPVGERHAQDLLLVTKTASGLTTENLGSCTFVPLIGQDAWPEESA